MRRTLCTLTACALALLLAAPALTQTPVRLPELDAATTPLGDDDLFLVRQDGQTRDKKVTWSTVRASLQDALVLVLGPASVCADNQLARWDGASATQLQCSDLSVLDVTPWDWSDGAGAVDTIDFLSIAYPFNIWTLKTKIRLGATSSLFPIAPATVYLGGDVVVEGGDITAPGALTIAAGGTANSITLLPTTTGDIIIPDVGAERPALKFSTVSGAPEIFRSGAGLVVRGNDNTYTSTYVATGFFFAAEPTKASLFQDVTIANAKSIAWSDGVDFNQALFGFDGGLEQRGGTTAQTYRLYGTYTDASNYERLSLSTTAGTGATIAVETDGTGADNLDLTIKPAGTGQLYVGAGGTTAAAPASVVVNATGGSGTDIAGASLTLAGGKGTGDAAGGSVVIQTSDPGSTGTTLQTLATRVTVGVERTTFAQLVKLHGTATTPASPEAGDIVFDSANALFCGYNGSAWVSFSGVGTCWAD